jgi:hypothetical protein
MIEQQSVERQTPFLSWSTSLPDRKWTKKKHPKKGSTTEKTRLQFTPVLFFYHHQTRSSVTGWRFPPPLSRNVEVHREPLSLGNLQSHTWWTNQNAFTQRKGEQTPKKTQNMYNIPHIKLTKKAFSPAHSSLLFFPPKKKLWRMTRLSIYKPNRQSKWIKRSCFKIIS